MKLKSGHFNLFSVMEFAAIHPIMPSPNDKAVQSEYANLLKSVTGQVPDLPGWYLWGHFNDMGWWETIYLGKAGKQKTSSLHTRLYGELRDECIAFWSQIYGKETMIKQLVKLRGGKWDHTRSLRKSGSQFVLWIAVDEVISEEEIKKQEDQLIKNFRPTHNVARWNQKVVHDKTTEEIEQVIEEELKTLLISNQ